MASIRTFFRFCKVLCVRGVLVARERTVTQQNGKMANPCGLRPKPGHSALLGIRLEVPNIIPRALIAPVWGSSDNNEHV
jgi:hypothetical protein